MEEIIDSRLQYDVGGNGISKTALNSTRNETNDELSTCANCSSPIYPSTSTNHSENNQLDATSNTNTNTSTNTDFNPVLHETEMNVIRMMLAEIYNLHYIPHLKNKYSSSSFISSSSSSCSTRMEEYNTDFPLCSSCSTLLADLFNLYSQFNKLRRMDSVLAKEIDVLKSLIKQQGGSQDESNIFMRRDIFTQPPPTGVATATTTTTTEPKKSKSNTSSKFTFSPNDGPWVRVGRRLEEMNIEEIGYAPPSLCHLYQLPDPPPPPEPNLIISNVCSSQSQITSDNEEDYGNGDDLDLDYEPLSYLEDEPDVDVKVFNDPLLTNEDNLNSEIHSKPTKNPTKRTWKFSKKPKKKKSPPVKSEMVQMNNENYNVEDDDGEPPAKKPLRSKQTKKQKVQKSKTPRLKKLPEPKPKSKPKTKSQKSKSTTEEPQIPTMDNNINQNVDEFILDLEIEPRVITYDEVVKKKNEEDEILLLKSDKYKKTTKRFRPGYEKRQITGLGCPCLYCLDDFATPEERADHVRLKHCQRKKSLCETCGATFASKHQLDYHLNKSVRKCSARLESNETSYMKRKKAMQSTHPVQEKSKEEERNFPCTVVINDAGDVCTYRAQNAAILKNHVQNVHCDAKEKVKCSECDAVLKNAHYFKMHFERMHTEKGRQGYDKIQEKAKARKRRQIKEQNAKGFICYHCNPPINFLTKARWTIHLTRAHNDYGTRYKITVCELCGKKFKGNYSLNKHLQFVHADLRPFVCEHCGLAFKSKSNLDTHISRVHTEEGRQQYNKYNRENYQRKKLVKQQKETGSFLNTSVENSSSLNASEGDQLSTTVSIESNSIN